MNLDACIDPPVLIRPIRPDDGERLSASHARLSPESRYRRFLSAKPELTGADVRYLVEVDGIDHIALVATQPSLPGEPIVAVARCIRIPGSPDTGEVAIVVADALQGKGVGTAPGRPAGRARRRPGDHAVPRDDAVREPARSSDCSSAWRPVR